jgi:hypothetical protein
MAVPSQSYGGETSAAADFENPRIQGQVEVTDPAKRGIVTILVNCRQKIVVEINVFPVRRCGLEVIVNLLLASEPLHSVTPFPTPMRRRPSPS